MQITIKGSRVQFINYVYNPEKKRTQGRIVATAPNDMSKIPDDVKEKLSESEIRQVEEWIVSRDNINMIAAQQQAILTLSKKICLVADGLVNPMCRIKMTTEISNAIYDSVDNLFKEMRKHGFKRPEKTKQAAKTEVDSSQNELSLDE